MKKCPMCAEEIQDAAIKCKHCGETFAQMKRFVCTAKDASGKTHYGTFSAPSSDALKQHLITNGYTLLSASEEKNAPTDPKRKCTRCNMEIPKGGMICPYCRKDPSVLGLFGSLMGNLFGLALIGLSFFIFPGFWAMLLSSILMLFKSPA